MWGTMIPLTRTILSAVYTSWFICGSCGFVENWIEDAQDLEKVRRKIPPLESR